MPILGGLEINAKDTFDTDTSFKAQENESGRHSVHSTSQRHGTQYDTLEVRDNLEYNEDAIGDVSDIETDEDEDDDGEFDFMGNRQEIVTRKTWMQQLGLVNVKEQKKGKTKKVAHDAAMEVIRSPTKVRRGRCVKKFQSSREFVVNLTFKMHTMPIRRCNILHFALGGSDIDTYIPSISVKPGRLNVSILSGKNFHDHCEPVCSCEIRGKVESRFSTPTSYDPHAPAWETTQTAMDALEDGQELEFLVWNKMVGRGHPVGRVALSKFLIYPDGYEGTLPLEVDSKANAIHVISSKAPSIYVKVSVETACRVVVRMRQGDRELDVHGPEGLPLNEETDVKFTLTLADSNQLDENVTYDDLDVVQKRTSLHDPFARNPWKHKGTAGKHGSSSKPSQRNSVTTNQPVNTDPSARTRYSDMGRWMSQTRTDLQQGSEEEKKDRRVSGVERFIDAVEQTPGAHHGGSLADDEPLSPNSPSPAKMPASARETPRSRVSTSSTGSSSSHRSSDAHGHHHVDVLKVDSMAQEAADWLGPTREYIATIGINSFIERTPIRLRLPNPSKVWVYMGNPREPAAPQCLVTSCLYRWVSVDVIHRPTIDVNEVSFDMPPHEAFMLARARELVEANQKWRVFDATFGALLILNGISIGLQIQLSESNPDLISADTWQKIERIFLGIFIVELFLRLIIMGRTWFLNIDHWLAFDAFVICISIFGILSEGVIELPFPVSVLRLLRLLKLAKMVRLVRAFKALGALVEAMMNSVETLLWTVMLLGFTLFIGSVFTVNLVSWVYMNDEENIPEDVRDEVLPWFKVSGAMWKFLLMTTYDGWAEPIRLFAFKINTGKANMVAVSMLCVWTLCAFGISNMVVGLMCHTAFVLGQRNTRMSNAHLLNEKRMVLAKFRRLLKTYGQRPIFKNDRFISREELIDAVTGAFQTKPIKKNALDDIFEEEGEAEDFQHKVFQTMKHYIDTLELTSNDFMAVSSVFAESGEIEIDGLIEALAIIQLQRYFSALNAMEYMTFGRVPLEVRPVDLLFFAYSLEAAEAQLRPTERNVMGLAAATLDIVELIDKAAEANGVMNCLDLKSLDVSAFRKMLKEQAEKFTVPDRVMGIEPLVRFINDYKKVAALGSLGLPVDALFGLFILLNGVFMAFQASDEDGEYHNMFYVIDLIFTVVFTIELIIRAMMFVSLEEDLFTIGGQSIHEDEEADENVGGIGSANIQTGEEYDMDKIKEYKSRFRFIFVPPCPKRGAREVLVMFPAFLSQPAIFFDFLVVSICGLDLMVLEVLRRTGVWSMDASVLSVVRVFRLTRLAKLLRILKLFPQLQKLLYVIVSTGRLIMWTVAIISIFLYMAAIVFVLICSGYKADTAKSPPDIDVNITNFTSTAAPSFVLGSRSVDAWRMSWYEFTEEERQAFAEQALYVYFGQLLDGIVSGFMLLTLDDWDDMVGMARVIIPLVCLIIVAMIIIGIMMMNMAVGVMCASSIGLVRRSQDEQTFEDLVKFLKSMGEFTTMLDHECGSRTLTREMLGEALELDMRRTIFRPDKRHEGRILRDLSQSVQARATSPEFVHKIRDILRKGKMVPVMCKHVFEAQDYERQGFVPLADFIQGGMVLKEDLAKLDMFACASGLRKVRSKSVEAHQRIAHCHHKLETLMETAATLICRLDHDKSTESRQFKLTEHQQLSRLYDPARIALSRLSAKTLKLKDPGANKIRWTCKKGTGLLREAEDFQGDDDMTYFEGHNTVFKHEVECGDHLVIEVSDKQKTHNPGDTRSKTLLRTVPAVVMGVISNSLMRCKLGEGAVNRDSWEHFHVVKQRKTDLTAAKGLSQSTAWTRQLESSYVKAPKPLNHPEHSWQLHSWNVDSRRARAKALAFDEKILQAHEKKVGATGINYHVEQAEKLVDFTLGHTPRVLHDLVHEAAFQEHQLLLQEYKDSLEMLFVLMDRASLQKCWRAWFTIWYQNPDNQALKKASRNNLKKRFGDKLASVGGLPRQISNSDAPSGEAARTSLAAADSSSSKASLADGISSQEDARNYLRAKAVAGLATHLVTAAVAPSPSPLEHALAKPAVVPVKWRPKPLAKARVIRGDKAKAEAAASAATAKLDAAEAKQDETHV